MRSPRRAAALVVAVCAGGAWAPAGALGANEVAFPFEPRPLTPPLYHFDPQHDQQMTFKASIDGTELFVEWWLPKPLDGNVPPPKLPTVLSIQYVSPVGVISGDHRAAVENLVSRGYAYAQAHVRGSHGSGGCWDRFGRLGQSDIGDTVEFVTDPNLVPWTDETVGLYGISENASTALAAAGLADRKKTEALKTVIAGSPVTTLYEFAYGIAGVTPVVPRPALFVAKDAQWSSLGLISSAENRPGERQACWPEKFAETAAYDGNFNDYMAERELRRGAANIDIPILVSHGFPDPVVPVRSHVGFFEEIPDTTRKVGLFGLFGHEWPDGDDWADFADGDKAPVDQKVSTDPAYTRADWQAMVVAWFDQYLKGVESGVDKWPTVQVQDTAGQWRAQDDWPATRGPAGQLALGSGGKLGVSTPTGSTSYKEIAYRNSNVPAGYPPGTFARFDLAVSERLEIAGQPMADLWVELDRPDAHIAVTLDLLDARGEPVPYASTWGFRSAQHLDPYVAGRFEQREPRLPWLPEELPLSGRGKPVRVTIPLEPRDLLIPAGGKLVLTIAGSAPWFYEGGLAETEAATDGFGEPSQLSGSATRVTILHSCETASALRFQMPERRRRLLNVLEDGEPEPLRASVKRDQRSDAAGTATAPVCGKTPPPMTEVLP